MISNLAKSNVIVSLDNSKDILNLFRLNSQEIVTKLRTAIKETRDNIVIHGSKELTMESIRIPDELMLRTLITEDISKMLIATGTFSNHILPTFTRAELLISNRLIRQMAEFRERNIERLTIKEILRQNLTVRRIRNNTHGHHEITIVISIILNRMFRRSKRLGRTSKLTKNIILIGSTSCSIGIGNLANVKFNSKTTNKFRHIHLSMFRSFTKMTKNKINVPETFTNISLKKLSKSISLTQIINRNTRRSQSKYHLTVLIRLSVNLGNSKALLTIRQILKLSSRNSTIIILNT